MAENLPDVVRVAYDFRSELERNEDEAMRRMARYWTDIEKELEAQYLALVQEIDLLKQSGQPITPQLVYSRDRYRSMMAQAQRELMKYEQDAGELISDYQRRDFLLGLDDANAILKASDPGSDIWTRVYPDAAEMMAGFAGNGAPLADLLQTDYAELGAKITDKLVSGVAIGKGPYAVAREMRDAAASLTYDRSVRIARTEINRAYRLANAQQYAASGVVEKVLRLAYKPTACFACLQMDGEECPNGIVDDHPNGKCSSVVKTFHGRMPEWQTGHEWLMEQSEADQRRIMGDGRYEMWKKDGISPRDMVTMRDNPVWGGSPSVISEKELRARFGLKKDGAPMISIPTVMPQQSTTIDLFDRNKVQYSPHGERLLENFQKANVDYREVSLLEKRLSEEEIINRLGGGDMTRGSCMSLSYAYAGCKNGLDVLDFRGGASRDIMARSQLYLENLRSVKFKILTEDDNIQGAIKLLGKVNPDKEYIFMAGNHTAIVRKHDGILQYLELQSPDDNGWKPFEKGFQTSYGPYYVVTSTSETLGWRFGLTTKSNGHCSLTDISLFENDDELRDLLGYINTAPDQQQKGAEGGIK